MSGKVETREFSIDDYDAAGDLWDGVEGSEIEEGDDRKRVAKFLARNPGLSRVAVDARSRSIVGRRCAVTMAGAVIFIISRSIPNVRGSDWGNGWLMNALMVCVAPEFSGRSFWSRTIIRAAASFGSAPAGRNFRAQSR